MPPPSQKRHWGWQPKHGLCPQPWNPSNSRSFDLCLKKKKYYKIRKVFTGSIDSKNLISPPFLPLSLIPLLWLFCPSPMFLEFCITFKSSLRAAETEPGERLRHVPCCPELGLHPPCLQMLCSRWAGSGTLAGFFFSISVPGLSLGNLCFLSCLRDSPWPGPTVLCLALAGETEMVQRGHNFTCTFPSCPFRTILTFLRGKAHKGKDMVWISSKPFKLVMVKAMWLNFISMPLIGNWDTQGCMFTLRLAHGCR